MPETKMNLKDLGPIHLMTLETSSLFLPFGSPATDYLKGAVGNQNGTRRLLKQHPIDFSPALRWSNSMASCLRTTGFGALEREGLVHSAGPAEPADPGVADFLPFEWPDVVSLGSNEAKIAPAVEAEDLPVSLPRVSALPLRPRMTFGPP